jgi:hypothetical protein
MAHQWKSRLLHPHGRVPTLVFAAGRLLRAPVSSPCLSPISPFIGLPVVSGIRCCRVCGGTDMCRLSGLPLINATIHLFVCTLFHMLAVPGVSVDLVL